LTLRCIGRLPQQVIDQKVAELRTQLSDDLAAGVSKAAVTSDKAEYVRASCYAGGGV